MRLGIGSFTYPWAVASTDSAGARLLDARALLRRAGALGVRVVQFADNLPLDRLSEKALDDLGAMAGDMDLRIEVGTRGIDEANLRAYAALAARFGASFVRVVVDRAEDRPHPDDIEKRLEPVLPDLERAGICLAIENHDRLPARVLAGMVERLGFPRVGVCLDTANSLGALDDLDTVLSELARFAVSVHVKDVVARRAPHGLGFAIEGCPAGTGQIDVPKTLDALRRAGRDVSVVLEQWPPSEADLGATVAKEASWAEESIAYLRTLV